MGISQDTLQYLTFFALLVPGIVSFLTALAIGGPFKDQLGTTTGFLASTSVLGRRLRRPNTKVICGSDEEKKKAFLESYRQRAQKAFADFGRVEADQRRRGRWRVFGVFCITTLLGTAVFATFVLLNGFLFGRSASSATPSLWEVGDLIWRNVIVSLQLDELGIGGPGPGTKFAVIGLGPVAVAYRYIVAWSVPAIVRQFVDTWAIPEKLSARKKELERVKDATDAQLMLQFVADGYLKESCLTPNASVATASQNTGWLRTALARAISVPLPTA